MQMHHLFAVIAFLLVMTFIAQLLVGCIGILFSHAGAFLVSDDTLFKGIMAASASAIASGVLRLGSRPSQADDGARE